MTHQQTDQQIVLIYDANSGPLAMAADVIKKLRGIEECALCEITHSAVGKRGDWQKCEATLNLSIAVLHRDELDGSWSLPGLPAVVLAHGDKLVRLLVPSSEIQGCRGDAKCLRDKIQVALEGAVS